MLTTHYIGKPELIPEIARVERAGQIAQGRAHADVPCAPRTAQIRRAPSLPATEFGLKSVTLSAAVLVLLFAHVAHAQISQFLFDGNGNLLVQSANLNAPP